FQTTCHRGKFLARYAMQNTVRSHFPHNPSHGHGSFPLQTALQMNLLYHCCSLPAKEKLTVPLSPFSFSSFDFSSKMLFPIFLHLISLLNKFRFFVQFLYMNENFSCGFTNLPQSGG